MATVYVTLSQVGARGAFGDMPVFGQPLRSETITSSAANAAGALVSRNADCATIFCATAIYANAGAAASPAAGIYVPAGLERTIALQAGQTVNVIDA